jgi:hypothetical protein
MNFLYTYEYEGMCLYVYKYFLSIDVVFFIKDTKNLIKFGVNYYNA